MSKSKLLVYCIPIAVCLMSFLLGGAKPTEAVQREEETVKEYTFIAPIPVSEVQEEETMSIQSFSITEEVVELTPTPTPTPTPEPEPVYDLTDEEIDLLARLISSEAGIESYKCKLAVGSIVLNRVKSDEFPYTLEEVIYQREPCVQFSVIISDNGRRPIEDEPSEESIQVAKDLAMNGTTIPDDVLVFYAEYIDTGWVSSRPVYDQIDHTVFAYLR